MRSNEELVAAIQRGERSLIPELWAQVERFIAQQARRRFVLTGGFGGATEEDLYQSGFFALLLAVNSYRSDAGMTFIGWLALYLKKAFAEAGGYSTRYSSNNPLHRAYSLDNKASGDSEDDDLLLNHIEDPTGAASFDDLEHSIWNEQLRKALDDAMAQLPEQQRAVLRYHYYEGLSFAKIGNMLGVSSQRASQIHEKALNAMRSRKRARELERFIELRTPYYLRTNVERFKSTLTSSVEQIVLLREQMMTKYLERRKTTV